MKKKQANQILSRTTFFPSSAYPRKSSAPNKDKESMVEQEEDVRRKLRKGDLLNMAEQVNCTKKSRVIKKNFTNKWAANFDKKNQGETLELWKSLESTTENFQKNFLDITRVRDANSSDPSSSAVTSVHFHPGDSLMLTTGYDKFLRLFSSEGKEFRKQKSIFFESAPINKAHFAYDGNKIVLASGRNELYSMDVCTSYFEKIDVKHCDRKVSFVESPCTEMITIIGEKTSVPLVSLKDNSRIGQIESKNINDVSFASSGLHIFTSENNGNICCWDIRTFRCSERFSVHGSTLISASPDNRHLVAGFKNGAVQIFANLQAKRNSKKEGLSLEELETAKEINSLTTEINELKFNNNGQLLAVSSHKKKNSLRLIHLPSYTVISNWPSNKTPLHYVSSTAFSHNNKYLAVGNARGRVLLYHMNNSVQR